MSDKFFFKGRQDARQSHIKYGDGRSATQKPGSKKYPLNLVVTNESRHAEVEALLKEANLHGNIKVDTSDGASELITELTVLLNKASSIKVAKVPSRNEPCVCGSGKKYKKCCGS
ncbi:SEC-C domain-containing protein [Paraglaciecola aquimarina]|uniref:SEC-C domain-containing protein n=1 Tax=Paraglaciecola algarum TaxID=3050085 RepID=A0ABS9DBR5_9ALTE|nr:PBPRA1643 family SWIM/SEC-C metal-binding motif protein [Paraglaciecola sp. G1-23]MCF2950412.1 SEC-C domain-containing protein [Paraglaciecola sp. G1-23]